MQPIHFATMANHADIVEMLVDSYGVDVHSKDEVHTYGTPRMYVCMYVYVYVRIYVCSCFVHTCYYV